MSHRKHARLRAVGSPLRTLDLTTARPAPKRADPIYHSPEYQRWRAIVIERAGGRCQVCGRSDGRLYADHIREIKDGGAPFDPANGQALCHAHHQAKTAAERAKRMARRFG